MSSATIHLVVPTLAVIATGLFPRKRVLMWAAFTVVPDFDFLFNFAGYYLLDRELLLHRAIFHNFFIGIPSALGAYLIWRRLHLRQPGLAAAPWRERWDAFGRQRWAHALVLVTIFMESHVLLDMFQGGITPFWPLWNVYIYPRFIIWVNTQTGQPSLESSLESGEGAPALTPEYPWLVPEELGILLLCAIAAIVAVWAESRRARGDWGELEWE